MVIERLSMRFSGEYLKRQAGIVDWTPKNCVNYNLCRGHQSIILSLNEDKWIPRMMSWGFGKDRHPDQRIINARAEGILGQPSFRFSIREKRAILPLDSFYVSVLKDLKPKVYRVVPFTETPMYLAVIWEEITETLSGHTLITVRSNKDMAGLTDRMPLVFFDVETAKNWCRSMNINQLSDMLGGTASGKLKYYQVSQGILNGDNSPLIHEPIQQHLTLFDQ